MNPGDVYTFSVSNHAGKGLYTVNSPVRTVANGKTYVVLVLFNPSGPHEEISLLRTAGSEVFRYDGDGVETRMAHGRTGPQESGTSCSSPPGGTAGRNRDGPGEARSGQARPRGAGPGDPERVRVRDGSSLTFDGTYSPPKRGKTEFRSWVNLQGGQSTCARIEAPAGQVTAMKPTLLTVLSNIRVMKGAVAPTAAAAPVRVQLVPYRLRDGSASFVIPQGWQCQDHGKGTFVAGNPGGYSFISGDVDLLTPQMRVNQPGILVSPYLAPGQAWQFITARYGLAANMRFEKVIPRADMARQMGQVYTAGPVTVEELI